MAVTEQVPATDRCEHGTHPDVVCGECVLASWESAPRPVPGRDALGDYYERLHNAPDDPRIADRETFGAGRAA